MGKALSTFAIAKLLHVDPGSVANWVDQGLLKAHRTPGGHRRVAPGDLVSFLREQGMPVPGELRPEPRVVVVENGSAGAGVIESALAGAGLACEVVAAGDAFAGGLVAATLRPDILVLSLHVPGMNAFEACRLLKLNEGTRGMSVIVIAPRVSPEDRRRLIRSGARACLGEPVDVDRLIAEVRALL